MSGEDSLVRCQVNCDDRFMLSLTRKFGAPHLLVQLLFHARLCMTQSVHLRPIVPLTLPSSLHTVMLPTLASRPSWHQISILHFWTMISTIISLQFRLLLTKILQESTEFTPQEHEVCLPTEASMAGSEATSGGGGKPRLKETLNLEMREVTGMGRQQLTQDQASLEFCSTLPITSW